MMHCMQLMPADSKHHAAYALPAICHRTADSRQQAVRRADSGQQIAACPMQAVNTAYLCRFVLICDDSFLEACRCCALVSILREEYSGYFLWGDSSNLRHDSATLVRRNSLENSLHLRSESA